MESESGPYGDLKDLLLRVVQRANRLRRARDRVERILAPMGEHGRRLVLKRYRPPEFLSSGGSAPAETPESPADIADDASVGEHDLDAQDEAERLQRASPLGERLFPALDDHHAARLELLASIRQAAERINRLHALADSDSARRWLELLFCHLDRLVACIATPDIVPPDWDPEAMREILGEVERGPSIEEGGPSTAPTDHVEPAAFGLRGQIERLRLLPGGGVPSDNWHKEAAAELAGQQEVAGPSLDPGGLHALASSVALSLLMQPVVGPRAGECASGEAGSGCDDAGKTQGARDAHQRILTGDDDGVYRPASWFREATGEGLYPDLLRNAIHQGRLARARKVGNRWQYPVEEVLRLWPEYADQVRSALERDADRNES